MGIMFKGTLMFFLYAFCKFKRIPWPGPETYHNR